MSKEKNRLLFTWAGLTILTSSTVAVFVASPFSEKGPAAFLLLVGGAVLSVVGTGASFVANGFPDRVELRSQLLPEPRIAKFVLLLLPKKSREHLIGDLDEEYLTVVLPEYGPLAARFWYWWQVLATLRPFLWAGLKRVAGFVLLWKSVR